MKSISTTTLVTILSIIHSTLAWTTPNPPPTMKSTTTQLFSSTTQSIEFAKYQGLGNDFILIDARDSSDPTLTPQQSAQLCNRNFGVGGDGVIFALAPPAKEDEEGYDFSMRIYNSDGSEPEMCGNGIRCLAAFLKDLGENAKSYKINTLAGPIVPQFEDDGGITVDMGEPILQASKVPCTLPTNAADQSIIEQTLECNNKTWKVSTVSMGNPHAIIFVNDLENDIDFESDGPALECDPSFPARINVEFVQVMSDKHLKMKVWERGAGPTLACGTGACALTVAAIRAGKIPRPSGEGSDARVRVTLPGGDLFIEWRESDNRVYMTGPADVAFSGTAVLK